MITSETRFIVSATLSTAIALTVVLSLSAAFKTTKHSESIMALQEQGYSLEQSRCALDTRQNMHEVVACMVSNGQNAMEAACALRRNANENCRDYFASQSASPIEYFCGWKLADFHLRESESDFCSQHIESFGEELPEAE